MDFKPTILISSTNHLDTFDAVLKATSSLKKFFGFYNVPDDFPAIKPYHANKAPLAYFSKGEVNFRHDTLHYNALKGNDLLNSYWNLNEDLSFVLNRFNINSIEWFSYERMSLRKFKWKWIRITCNEDILGGDFLICADGVTNTKKLFEMLNQFKESNVVSVSLNDFSGSKIPLIGYIALILLFINVILDLIVTATYGTINYTIWGPILVIILLLAMVLFFISLIWYLIKIKENSKIRYHGQLLLLIFWVFAMFNVIRNHFYP